MKRLPAGVGGAGVKRLPLMLCVAALLPACSSSHPTKAAGASVPSTVASQSTASSSATTAPTGSSTATLPLGAYTNDTGAPGARTITILAAGQYTEKVGGFQIKGTWVSTTGQVTFTETLGGLCTNIPGSYNWVLTKNLLTLNPISDTCADRRVNDLSNGSWTKQP